MNDVPKLIKNALYKDSRGGFTELWKQSESIINVKQINSSVSMTNVARGLHGQVGQSKLVACLSGRILDIVLDIRTEEQVTYELIPDGSSVYIPATHFVHGFVALEPSIIVYGVSEEWNKEKEILVNIQASIDKIDEISYSNLVLSNKDKNAPSLETFLLERKF